MAIVFSGEDLENNMQKNIDLSVIITVYNISEYIGECIESVLVEHNINIEVILVDDKSTDNSLEICEKYVETDSRIVLIKNDKNLGITASRNAGLRAAKGEYSYVIDGDDLVAPNACAKMVRLCKENNLDMLEFSADILYESEEMKKYSIDDEYYIQKYMLNRIASGPELFADNQKNYDARWGNTCLRCVRTQFLQSRNLYFVEGLRYADGSGFHLYMEAERVMIVPDVFYSRRVRANSQVTTKPRFYYLESLIILFTQELNLWDRYSFTPEVNRGIECYFQKTNRQIIDMYQQFKNESDYDYILFNDHPAAKYFFEYYLCNKPLCLNFLSDNDVEKYKSMKKVYIYGAGFYASQLSKVFDYYDIQYEYVITSIGDNARKIGSKQVHEVSEMDFQSDDMVFIAVAEKHQKEIVENLTAKGCKNWKQFVV